MGQTMDQMKLINQLRKAQKELKNEINKILREEKKKNEK